MQQLGHIIKMMKDFEEGYMGFSEKLCADALKSVLPIIWKHHKNNLKSYSIDELRIYLNLLIIMLIDDKLPV